VCRWENNNKMDLKEIWIKNVGMIQLPQDIYRWWAFVSRVMNILVS
jgi:hypothetical protein